MLASAHSPAPAPAVLSCTAPCTAPQARRLAVERNGSLAVPANFVQTAKPFDPADPAMRVGHMPQVRSELGWGAWGGLGCLGCLGAAGVGATHRQLLLAPTPAGRHTCLACAPAAACLQHAVRNPQTEALLSMLGLPWNMDGGGGGGDGFGGAPGGGWAAPAGSDAAAAGAPTQGGCGVREVWGRSSSVPRRPCPCTHLQSPPPIHASHSRCVQSRGNRS